MDADAGAADGDGSSPPDSVGAEATEMREREAAWRRGTERAAGAERPPFSGAQNARLFHRSFTALAQNVRDNAVFLMDPNGIITFWGEGARLMEWWTRDEAEGAHLRMLYPNGGGEDGAAEDHLRYAAEHGEYIGEGHRVRSDLSTFWAGLTLTALRDDDGELIGFAKLTRDLTARRAADAALKAAHTAAEEARRHAEEANRLKSLFLATMSHEIRTPLNAIMAYTDILTMELGGPLTAAQQSQLGKIRSSSQHLLGIIEDVLDLSRVEAGRMVVGRSPLLTRPVVGGALTLIEPQAAAQGVDVVNATSGQLADTTFWGDEERVRQILLNLLSNAVKFTDPGGRVTVSVGTAETPSPDAVTDGPGPWVYFRVEDTGRGIPPDRFEKIFEPFVQADMELTRQHGGSGLGLAISRRLARLMGGDLTVRSRVGVGSAFFVWLSAAPIEQLTAQNHGSPGSDVPRPLIFREVREAILSELERILAGFVARLRHDSRFPAAASFAEAELEDHLASLLTDFAQTLGGMDLTSGAESPELRDGTWIQRRIAERHGEQRFRLGWSEKEVRLEYQILREEVAAAVRRRVHRERAAEVEEMIGTLGVFMERAEAISAASYRSAARLAPSGSDAS